MVNDVNFIAKKMKDIKFWGKYMLCTSKESWKHVEFIFRLKKYDISKKNQFFDFFDFFFFWCQSVKFHFFSIFQNFKIFFLKMASMGRIEYWKKQSYEIWAHLGHPLRSHVRSSTCACGFHPPPCSIGLRGWTLE